MNQYEWKQEQRRERLERAATRAKQESDARFAGAHNAIAGIPFGQPILVDHYSARRHRAALKRHDQGMRAGFAALERATELAQRAAGVGTGGISSDDPDAVEKLGDKVAELEADRDAMKRANAFYKTHGTLEGCELSARLRASGESVLRHQAYYRKPFPPYALSNLGARIRDAKKRTATLAQVPALQAAPAIEAETIGGLTITVDVDELRVVIKSAARLSKEAYKEVRSAGFVWSPTRDGFVRKFNPATLNGVRWKAQRAAAAILKMESQH